MSEGLLSLVGTPLQEAKGIVDSPEIATNDFLKWAMIPRNSGSASTSIDHGSKSTIGSQHRTTHERPQTDNR